MQIGALAWKPERAELFGKWVVQRALGVQNKTPAKIKNESGEGETVKLGTLFVCFLFVLCMQSRTAVVFCICVALWRICVDSRCSYVIGYNNLGVHIIADRSWGGGEVARLRPPMRTMSEMLFYPREVLISLAAWPLRQATTIGQPFRPKWANEAILRWSGQRSLTSSCSPHPHPGDDTGRIWGRLAWHMVAMFAVAVLRR